MSSQIVEAVREEFPKFSKAALSLARRPDETGVTFVPRAAEIIEAIQGRTAAQGSTSSRRRKSISFFCRLTPAAAGRVKREITRRGTSQQALIEGLLLAWAEWSEEEVREKYFHRTKGDEIRAKTDEELCVFLAGIYTLDTDAYGDYDPCVVIDDHKFREPNGLMDWLKSPAGVDE